MADEKYAEQVVDLALVPVRPIVKARDARDGRGLVRVRFYSDPRVVSDAEHVVDDLKTLVFGWIVDGRYVGYHCVFRCGMVFEEGEDGYDPRWWNVYCKFVLPDGKLLDVFGQAGDEVLTVGM